jgi:hypothetical protein
VREFLIARRLPPRRLCAAQEEEKMVRVPFAHRLSCTREEACAATGIEPEDLEKEIAAGRLWTAKIGGHELIIVASLLQFLADMAQPAWPPAPLNAANPPPLEGT